MSDDPDQPYPPGVLPATTQSPLEVPLSDPDTQRLVAAAAANGGRAAGPPPVMDDRFTPDHLFQTHTMDPIFPPPSGPPGYAPAGEETRPSSLPLNYEKNLCKQCAYGWIFVVPAQTMNRHKDGTMFKETRARCLASRERPIELEEPVLECTQFTPQSAPFERNPVARLKRTISDLKDLFR